ncbi:MAG: glycosyltransferase family 39 protein [Candidatus Zixiibacteriota bacterium]
MIDNRRFRQLTIAVVVASALLRVGFLTFGDVVPVIFDARRYAAAALGVISYLDRSVRPAPDDENQDRANLQYYVDKYLEGERIHWLPYKPHTLSEARDDIMVGGPLYPSVLAILFVVSPVGDLTVARLFGVLLDIVSTLLVILIARRLVGTAAAFVAGLFYALYFPFIQTSTMLLLESSTSFLLLAAIALVLRALENDSRSMYLGAGSLVAVLVLNKPTAMLLVIPLAIGIVVNHPSQLRTKDQLRRLSWFVAPVAVVFAAWLTVGAIKYGQLSLRDPMYQESGLRSSSSVLYEGYDLDIVSANFWSRGIYSDIMQSPLEYAGLFIKKFDRLWGRPYNDFRKSFITPYRFDESFHLILVVAGLFGMILLAVRSPHLGSWSLLIAGYYTAIHLIYHSVSRYSFNALPLVLISAAYAFVTVGAAVLHGSSIRKPVVLGVVVLAAAWILDYQWPESIGIVALTHGWVVLMLVVKTGLLMSGLALLSTQLFKGEPRWRSMVLILTVAGFLAVPMFARAISRDNWSEFSCRLNSPDHRAGTRLYISDLDAIKAGDPLGIVLDMTSNRTMSGAYSLRIGEFAHEFQVAEKPPFEQSYVKTNYDYVMKLADIARNEIRQYAYISVDRTLIAEQVAKAGYLDVSISPLADSLGANSVTVYATRDSGRDAFIPSMRYTSLERWVCADDPRLRLRADFMSDSAISYYIGPNSGAENSGGDLSDAPGLQTGRFHILLMHFRSDSSLAVY